MHNKYIIYCRFLQDVLCRNIPKFKKNCEIKAEPKLRFYGWFIRLLCSFAIVAGPCRDLFTAVRAGAGDDELNASAISAVAAGLMTRLAVVNRIGVDVIFRAFARRVAALSPLIDRIEARAVVGAAVLAAFLLQFADI